MSTPNLDLTELTAQQETPSPYADTLYNIDTLDYVCFSHGINYTDTPPGSPSVGDVYLIGNTPTGAWASNADDVTYQDANRDWVFITAQEGMEFYDQTNDKHMVYDGTEWVEVALSNAEFATATDAGSISDTGVGGTDQSPNTKVIRDPTDAPESADVLRDNLVATTLPDIRDNFNTLVTHFMAIRTALQDARLML